jgi:ribulose 1,5-bisphosphate synthetase/thiazole synthase
MGHGTSLSQTIIRPNFPCLADQDVMSQNEMHFDVAIIGAGFSGTMVAVHLFKDGCHFPN